MKNVNKQPTVFNSISELHRALGLPKPLHPLISLVDYENITVDTAELEKGMLFNFYKISYKKNLLATLFVVATCPRLVLRYRFNIRFNSIKFKA